MLIKITDEARQLILKKGNDITVDFVTIGGG